MRKRAAWTAGIAVALIATCTTQPPIERPPVELSLQLATRQSCGVLSGLDYDTTCLAAIHVRVLDANRALRDEYCQPLDEPVPANLRELLLGDAVLNFSRLSTNATVIFEVRGLQNANGSTVEELCASAGNASNWLFWGASPQIDLRAFDDSAESQLVTIFLDCRDCEFECPDNDCFGCAAFSNGDPPTCNPNAFPESFCIPTTTCDKVCEADVDCFGGLRTCEGDRCDISVFNGGFCSPCNEIIQCAEGLVCLERPSDIRQNGFCAPACPDTFCSTGTKCNRLGNDLRAFTP